MAEKELVPPALLIHRSARTHGIFFSPRRQGGEKSSFRLIVSRAGSKENKTKMARMLVAKAKKAVVSGRKLVIAKARNYYVRELGKDLQLKEGRLNAKQLKAKNGSKIKTSFEREFCIFDSTFIDDWKNISRGPQIVLPKDIGIIVIETGLNDKSIAVDIGTGSGALACSLAHICKKVTSYDIKEEHSEIGKQNAKFLKLKNINFKTKDATKGIDEKNVNLVVLDIPEPRKAIAAAEKALAVGGFLVSYSPTVIPMQKFANEIEKNPSFAILKNIELIARDWKIEGESARPVSTLASHTGFLTFARRIC